MDVCARRRVELTIDGVVQGVGFRPFVYRLATDGGLDGYVRNDRRGVVVEVEGRPGDVERFLASVEEEAPPMARVGRISQRDVTPRDRAEGFTIVDSRGSGEARALVSADVATCGDCIAEIFEPADRRYRYPFTNCINCGPRFTIATGVPYDRAATTMAGFEMCGLCWAEYEDPRDRRFHAQPNACPVCGPALRLIDAGGSPVASGDRADLVGTAAAALLAGSIVAVKGVGGYHLACLARSEQAVGALRARKHREDRPFALMAPTLEAAHALVELSSDEVDLLAGPEAPIVVARRRHGARVSAGVAPNGIDLGVMLPYSPLHHLLVADVGEPLVMTSANVSDEPIAFEDRDAISRLSGIADLLLSHDRPIHTRTDDSVVRSLRPGLIARRPGPLLIRRSRGHVPAALPLPAPLARPVLACGAELKNAFCVAKADRAWVSHHVGDLKNYETLQSFERGIDHFQRLFAVEPEIVVHDLHPDYISTTYALAREGVDHVAVQHHHAHLAAVLAEHGEIEEAVGAIYDGAGLGPDGTVWGGELLIGSGVGYERAGLLFPVRLPGGDAAVREPWRMACSWLSASSSEESPPIPARLANRIAPARWNSVCELIRGGVASPLTSSVGRLFDAVAALCGLRTEVTHEGQAASELEGIAVPQPGSGYPMPLVRDGEAPTLIDARETVRAILCDLDAGTEPALVSGRFHESLASATARAMSAIASARGLEATVLAGGAFQNRLLLERTVTLLEERGCRVLIPRLLPPNDGAIAYGQVAVVASGGPRSE